MAGIANQGKTIGNDSTDYLNNKEGSCYSTCQDELLPFIGPEYVPMAVLIFHIIIIYAMDMFDGFSPVE